MDKIKIKIIIGSTRPNRFSEKPAHWIFGELKKKEGIETEILDLREYPMPFFDSITPPIMANGEYENTIVQNWAKKIKDGDAIIIVTPEYNHGYPAVLKNALDVIFIEWNKKAVGFVSYGGVGGARVVEQLREVVIELQMIPIRNAINIPVEVFMRAMKENIPVNPEIFEPVRHGFMGDCVEAFFDELIWIAKALKTARESNN
ncbi:NAD(P)H-dependent oxidoreductase [Candidatus Woesearchaeota archaeon]|nr:NAD(P)H-dependent oxidoreductase [Candidatus Woesearchaeota archaeon]